MGFKEIVFGIIIVGLFSISLLYFTGFSSINNNSTSILDSSEFGSLNESLNEQLNSFDNTANSQHNSTKLQGNEKGNDNFFLNIIPTIFAFIGTSLSMVNIIFDIFSDFLGVPRLLLNVIGGMFLITLLLLGWRVIKSGGT